MCTFCTWSVQGFSSALRSHGNVKNLQTHLFQPPVSYTPGRLQKIIYCVWLVQSGIKLEVNKKRDKNQAYLEITGDWIIIGLLWRKKVKRSLESNENEITTYQSPLQKKKMRAVEGEKLVAVSASIRGICNHHLDSYTYLAMLEARTKWSSRSNKHQRRNQWSRVKYHRNIKKKTLKMNSFF